MIFSNKIINLASYYKITPESVIFAMLRAAGASLPEAYFFSHAPFKKLDGNNTQELYKAAAALRDANPGIKSMIKTFSESREKKYKLLQAAKENNKLFNNEEEIFTDDELLNEATNSSTKEQNSINPKEERNNDTIIYNNDDNNINKKGESNEGEEELNNNNKYNNSNKGVDVLKTRAGLIDSMINAVRTTRGKERVQALQTLAKLQEKDFEDEEEEEKRVKIYLPFNSDCRQCKLFQDAKIKSV